jgi:hypothetical protein
VGFGTAGLTGEAVAAFAGAGATLLTGLAAVIGASIIGVKQTRISKAQTELLTEQTKVQVQMARLAEIELRAALFQQRMAYYELFGRYLRAVRSSDPNDAANMHEEFLTKSREAEFLFPAAIKPEIDAIWILGFDYQEAAKDLNSGDPAEVREARETRTRVRSELQNAYDRFVAVAGEHLRLT